MPPPDKSNPPDPLGLFTDGPPHWIMSKGKKCERPSQTLPQAASQKEDVAKQLHWHGNRNGDMATINLEAKLLDCKPAGPCLSGACPICMRAQQRLLVIASMHILPQLPSSVGGRPKAISFVPEFGRVELAGLANFDIKSFQQETCSAIRASGVSRFLLALDASLNHEDGKADEAYWQFQWWGFLDEPNTSWRERLKKLANPSRTVRRPVKVVAIDLPEAAAAYGLKNGFTRRVSIIKANLDREDRGQCSNTINSLLRGPASVELMLFLDRIGLEKRLLGRGLKIPFQPLRSRKPSNSDGDK